MVTADAHDRALGRQLFGFGRRLRGILESSHPAPGTMARSAPPAPGQPYPRRWNRDRSVRQRHSGIRAVGVVGIDSFGMLARAAGNRTALVAMDAMTLGFTNRTFDIAVLAFVLFRVPDPCAALTEVKRALRHRGTVEVTTWAVGPATPASQIWDQELSASGAWDPSPQPPDQDDLMNTPDKLERLLHGAGFAPERIWIEHLEYQWAFPRFTGLRTSFGASKRRLATLDPPTRAAFGDRNNERMSRLSSKELMCRGTAICATAVT